MLIPTQLPLPKLVDQSKVKLSADAVVGRISNRARTPTTATLRISPPNTDYTVLRDRRIACRAESNFTAVEFENGSTK